MSAYEQPSYRDIAADLRQQIRSGLLKPHARLPTKRELCVMYGVSRQTIDSAMIVLRTEGLIRGATSLGTFVVDPLPPLDNRGRPDEEPPATSTGKA